MISVSSLASAPRERNRAVGQGRQQHGAVSSGSWSRGWRRFRGRGPGNGRTARRSGRGRHGDGPELVPVGASPLEPGSDLDEVAVGDRSVEPLELVLELPDRPQDLVAVLPRGSTSTAWGRSRAIRGRVPQAAPPAKLRQPGSQLARKEQSEDASTCGAGADVGHDLVVLVGIERHDLGPEVPARRRPRAGRRPAPWRRSA